MTLTHRRHIDSDKNLENYFIKFDNINKIYNKIYY